MSDMPKSSYLFHSSTSNEFPSECKNIDIAFVGERVDDRGFSSVEEIYSHSKNVHIIKFDPEQQLTLLNDTPIQKQKLVETIQNKKRILIDATTVGLGEILQILLATNKASIKEIEFVYAEPGQYTQQSSNNESHHNSREFALTHNCVFRSVQGFAHQHDNGSPASHIFMLGFEQGRILNAFEQRAVFDLENYKCHFIIGVPAFKAGWESNSIRPHLDILDELKVSERAISYCQANSIRESYHTLWDLYTKIGDERKTLFVSPLGTKPHTVGAALFLFETKGNDKITSLYYDHPKRLINRSRNIERWHYVNVMLLPNS